VITVPAINDRHRLRRAGGGRGAYADRFSGRSSHRVLGGIGHNVPEEAPEAFADAVLEAGGGK
jgi:pimeloyl-ACP methyl ester carboxylesterase